jgi:uncharacterized membrane protein YsdA (DUF1294 family)
VTHYDMEGAPEVMGASKCSFEGSAMANNRQPPPPAIQPARVDTVQPRFKPRSAYRTSAIIAAIPWLALFGFIIYETDWHYLIDWIIAGTAVTFVFFVADKLFSQTGGSRVPERTLLGMILLGGMIGGWAGMSIFRHKTLHRSFWAVLIIASIIWIAVGVWFFILR